MAEIGICELCEDGDHGAAEALQVPAEEQQNSALTVADNSPTGDHEALIRALQAEIARHDLTEFMQPDTPFALIGCSRCAIRPATLPYFINHLINDVIPSVVKAALNSNSVKRSYANATQNEQ